MRKLRIGIVGCGSIAHWAHMDSYQEMDNVEIVAVCDIIKERAEEMKKEYNLTSAKVYQDYNDLIADPDVESVDVCTPNYLHSKVAVAALNAGKHVFTEKPDAINVEEVKKMEAAAKASGKTLMVMRNNRFSHASRWLKKYIEDGKMGEIYAARCGWIRQNGEPASDWFADNSQSGGGALIDLGVHMIDLAIWLMGNPHPVSVSANTYSKFGHKESRYREFGGKVIDKFDVDDLTMGFIKFDNGACLQLEFSWASNVEQEKRFVELRGTEAGAYWTGGHLKLIHEDANGDMTSETPEPHYPEPGEHAGNLHNYVDVVLNGAEPCFKIEQGVDMIKILRAVYESAQTGKEVRL